MPVVLAGKVVEFKGFLLPSCATRLLVKRINCLAILCVAAYLYEGENDFNFIFEMFAIQKRKVVGDTTIILLPYRKIQPYFFNLKKEERRSWL